MLRTVKDSLAISILVAASFFILGRTLSTSGIHVPSLLNVAAVFNVDNISADDLLAKYERAGIAEGRVRIFLMPGHEPEYGGAEYRQLKERELVLALGDHLKRFLERDPHFDVVMGRNGQGWNPDLKRYFETDWEEIEKWRTDQARIMRKLIQEGGLSVFADQAKHPSVPGDVGTRLYGMNKWIGENNFDLAIHLHVNDFGGRRAGRPGEYEGYAVYVPEKQYSNSRAAYKVAKNISDRLAVLLAESDLPKETGGIVENQELVAVGRYNTADVPSMLIEYGYIYEPQYQDAEVRDVALEEYAYQTYLGLKDFFSSEKQASDPPFMILPFTWKKTIQQDNDRSVDVFALQAALRSKGIYPPKGEDLHSCPISGVFGGCTARALSIYEDLRSIGGKNGILTQATADALNLEFAATQN